MFEKIKFLSTDPVRLNLATKKGRDIVNEVALPITEREKRRDAFLYSKYGNRWESRKEAYGIYNCAGHVWASRRTAIREEKEWQKIIDDDGYKPLNLENGDKVFVDDIVLYRDKATNELIHVGRVVKLEGLHSGAGNMLTEPNIISIVSKWDDTTGEYVHLPFDVGHIKDNWPNYEIVYITDRMT